MMVARLTVKWNSPPRRRLRDSSRAGVRCTSGRTGRALLYRLDAATGQAAWSRSRRRHPGSLLGWRGRRGNPRRRRRRRGPGYDRRSRHRQRGAGQRDAGSRGVRWRRARGCGCERRRRRGRRQPGRGHRGEDRVGAHGPRHARGHGRPRDLRRLPEARVPAVAADPTRARPCGPRRSTPTRTP